MRWEDFSLAVGAGMHFNARLSPSPLRCPNGLVKTGWPRNCSPDGQGHIHLSYESQIHFWVNEGSGTLRVLIFALLFLYSLGPLVPGSCKISPKTYGDAHPAGSLFFFPLSETPQRYLLFGTANSKQRALRVL